ncbi:hypothetical protein PSENEW3_00000957 [Picochlorum sp. SENEW3]|nr:hypothetical protein PSENEW3_00000957 [Picochlorum sp. SENEW3]
MSNVKQADVVSHVALADVLECRTLPRSVAANLEKVAGRDGQVSVDALVDMVVTDHESGGNRKVLRRSVLGITIAMVCLSAVVCGLVFGSVHLTTQMQVQDGVLYARDSADTVMHSGTTVAAFSPSDLQNASLAQLQSLDTLMYESEDGTLGKYKTSSVSVAPDGSISVVTLSGDEFFITPDNISSVDDDSEVGRRRLQVVGTTAAIALGVVFVGASVYGYSGGDAAGLAKAEAIGQGAASAAAALG